MITKPHLVPARDIADWGGCFRKRTGSYPHMRISEGAVSFLKLDPNFVYGVCPNGNVSKIDPGTLVAPLPLLALLRHEIESSGLEIKLGVIYDEEQRERFRIEEENYRLDRQAVALAENAVEQVEDGAVLPPLHHPEDDALGNAVDVPLEE